MKIITSIMAIDRAALLKEVESYKALDFDILEWRADYFLGCVQELCDISAELHKMISQPLLFTFRTKEEGGERSIPISDYIAMNKVMIDSGNIDMIDLELFTGDEAVKIMAAYAHSKGVEVIISNHDFHQTPPKDEIINRLQKMHSLGADIAKIALMPQTAEDVLTLLSATTEVYKQTDKPIITISMGKLGVISRIADVFGSYATFGAANMASAPGQISVDKLRMLLNIVSR